MKKYLYIILAVLCGMLAACTDTTKIGPEDYPDPADIRLSSTKLIFDADGGFAAVIVTANTESWNYVASGDWFTVNKKDDNTLEISVSLNARPELNTGSLTVSGKKDGEEATAEVELIQRSDRSVNLSAEGTANCYMAKTNGAYKFDARIKGNGGGDGGSTYITGDDTKISGITHVDLLWEARNDGDKTMSRDIIDGTPVYQDGYISFSTGRSQGNAVIAARNVSGDILWSWHIWVLDEEIDVHDHFNAPGKPAVAQIMDRNLGAMNNTPDDVNNRGMFYQWGRKDPIPAARSPYMTVAADGAANNVANDEVGNGTGTWNFYGKSQPIVQRPGNIAYATKNPMTFLDSYDITFSHWYCMTKDTEIFNDGLWGEEKTIFDPCPVGYKVPGEDTWGIPVGNTRIKTGGDGPEYDENGESPEYLWNAFKDYGRTWKLTGDYYPAAGSATTLSSMTHANTSIYGFYWTSHNHPSAGRYYRVDFTPHWAEYFAAAPVYSAQIRCVKE
ncbi:BACON domain-containing protein [uncultured Alistipes sp.]|uniref:BACON domain-containing protein n=1 Tax=uncultured Alistipes sp. TaxID=538949 RepID=UPI0025CE10C5|nr:BACON domain-containing protein [uncultured Alistipes sp.]